MTTVIKRKCRSAGTTGGGSEEGPSQRRRQDYVQKSKTQKRQRLDHVQGSASDTSKPLPLSHPATVVVSGDPRGKVRDAPDGRAANP